MRERSTVFHNGKLLRILNARSMISIVVRGHSAIDGVLATAISEVLPSPHALEVRRLDASMKIDLSTALRIIPGESRAAFQKLNKIRNQFAHDPIATMTTRQANEFRNAFAGTIADMLQSTKTEQTTPTKIVRHGIGVLYIFARGSLARLRDQSVADREWIKIASEVLRKESPPPEFADLSDEARVAAAVNTERTRRQLSGSV